MSPISEPQPDFSRDVFTGFADTVSTDPVFTATISNDMVSTTMAQESVSLQNIQPCVELNSASAEMESPNQSTISDQGDVNSADGLSLSFEGVNIYEYIMVTEIHSKSKLMSTQFPYRLYIVRW